MISDVSCNVIGDVRVEICCLSVNEPEQRVHYIPSVFGLFPLFRFIFIVMTGWLCSQRTHDTYTHGRSRSLSLSLSLWANTCTSKWNTTVKCLLGVLYRIKHFIGPILWICLSCPNQCLVNYERERERERETERERERERERRSYQLIFTSYRV